MIQSFVGSRSVTTVGTGIGVLVNVGVKVVVGVYAGCSVDVGFVVVSGDAPIVTVEIEFELNAVVCVELAILLDSMNAVCVCAKAVCVVWKLIFSFLRSGNRKK